VFPDVKFGPRILPCGEGLQGFYRFSKLKYDTNTSLLISLLIARECPEIH
jgi:hypothetical protein